MTHTPTPWTQYQLGPTIYGCSGNYVGITQSTDAKADAEFIVTAVNAFDEMLALARDYRGAVEFYMRADLKRGDTEGANMKRLTMDYIDSQIAKATAP